MGIIKMNYMSVVLALLLALATAIPVARGMVCTISGCYYTDYEVKAILERFKPPYLPPLESYSKYVDAFVNRSACKAKINYVALFAIAENGIYDPRLSWLWITVKTPDNKTYDLAPFGLIAVSDFQIPGIIHILAPNATGSIIQYNDAWLMNNWFLSGASMDGILYVELNETYYKMGYLYAERVYMRINETTIVDLKSTGAKWGYDNKSYQVYCPLPAGVNKTNIDRYVLSIVNSSRYITVTQYMTVVQTETTTQTTTATQTVVQRETLTQTTTYPVTELLTATVPTTVTQVQTQTVEKTATQTVEKTQTLFNTVIATERVTETQTVERTATVASTYTTTVKEAQNVPTPATVAVVALAAIAIAAAVCVFLRRR